MYRAPDLTPRNLESAIRPGGSHNQAMIRAHRTHSAMFGQSAGRRDLPGRVREYVENLRQDEL